MSGRLNWCATVPAVVLVVVLMCVMAVPAAAGDETDWGRVFERARKRHNDFDWSHFDKHHGVQRAGDAGERQGADTEPAGQAGQPVPETSAPEVRATASEPVPPDVPVAGPSMAPLPVIPVPNPPRTPEPAPEPVPEKRYRIDFPGIEARKPAPEPAPAPSQESAVRPGPETPAAAPTRLLTPEQEARARAEALAQPEPTVDVKSFDPKAWREATADAPEPVTPQAASVPEAAATATEQAPSPEPVARPLLTPEQEARARAEVLASPEPSIDVATLDPAAWREAVTPKPAYGPVEVEHFLNLALYDAVAQTAHLDGGPAPRSLVVSRRAGEVRLRVLGKVPAREAARVEGVLRSLAPVLAELSGLGVRLVPASDKTANANVFVMAASPGDALEGYTKLTLDDGQAILRSDTVLYQGVSDAAVMREALRAMGLIGRSMSGRDTAGRESVMRPMPRAHGLPDLDAQALAMLYRPELHPGMDYTEAKTVLEALKK